MSNPNREYRTLSEDLAELERTDPDVAAVVARLEQLASPEWKRRCARIAAMHERRKGWSK